MAYILLCGIELLVKDNRIIQRKGTGPPAKGFICPKGRAMPEIVHSMDKIRRL